MITLPFFLKEGKERGRDRFLSTLFLIFIRLSSSMVGLKVYADYWVMITTLEEDEHFDIFHHQEFTIEYAQFRLISTVAFGFPLFYDHISLE